MIAPAATLKNVDCKRIGLDPQRCFEHAKQITRILPLIRNKVMEVFKPYPPGADSDPDHMIYSGGFFPDSDRRLMDKIHLTAPEKLASISWPFKDSRLNEMLFRYRARNYPDTLSLDESRLWQSQRLERLNRPANDRQLTPESFRLEILAARQSHAADKHASNILDQLEAWGNEICRAD
jgi:exodeoxyribonuclease-1